MAYQIQCLECDRDTWAGNIADLIEAHTNECGRLVCGACGGTEAYIHRITGLWEKEPDEAWNGYIKGVLRIGTKSATYCPYVFLTADSVAAEVSGIRFSYYKNPGPSGRLTDGPGPGGAPRLAPAELLQLLERLSAFGVVKVREREGPVNRTREDAPVLSPA